MQVVKAGSLQNCSERFTGSNPVRPAKMYNEICLDLFNLINTHLLYENERKKSAAEGCYRKNP